MSAATDPFANFHIAPEAHTPPQAQALLQPYRRRIDELDQRLLALLAERMGIIHEVSALKLAHAIAPVLRDRVEEVIGNAADKGAPLGLDPAYVRRLWQIVVEESCRVEDAFAAKGDGSG